MYRLSVYMFVFIFYPSLFNLWIFKNHINKTFIFTLSLNIVILSILIGLGAYYDKMGMIFWNIVTALIMGAIIIICWIIRKFFTPNIIKQLDFKMADQKDKTNSIEEEQKNLYKKSKKFIVIVSAIYFMTAVIISSLNMLKVIEVLIDPLPYIWVGILLVSAYVSFNFSVRNIGQ